MPELVVMSREDFEGVVRDAVREGVAEAMRDVTQRPGDWLTEQEAAALLGVATSTLRSWRTRGRGPAYSKRGRVMAVLVCPSSSDRESSCSPARASQLAYVWRNEWKTTRWRRSLMGGEAGSSGSVRLRPRASTARGKVSLAAFMMPPSRAGNSRDIRLMRGRSARARATSGVMTACRARPLLLWPI